MAELDEFLDWVRNDLRAAEIALHDGDATARRAIWAHRDPVTVFGAWKNAVGHAEADELFAFLERTFSGCTSHVHEIVAADVVGDMHRRLRAHAGRRRRGGSHLHPARDADLSTRGRRVEGRSSTRRHAP